MNNETWAYALPSYPETRVKTENREERCVLMSLGTIVDSPKDVIIMPGTEAQVSIHRIFDPHETYLSLPTLLVVGDKAGIKKFICRRIDDIFDELEKE